MEHNYKNKYGTDLGEVQSKLHSSPLAQRFIEKASSGKLMAFAHAIEKYNHDVFDKEGRNITPQGPPWDVEGHTCEDIYVHLPMNLFSKRFFPDYVEKFKQWFETGRDESGKGLSLDRVKQFFHWLWAMRCIIEPHHQYWAFVVDSFETQRSYMAEDIMEERLGGDHRSVLNLMRKDYVAYQKLESEIIAELTDEVMEERLKERYNRINSYMWVEKSDPTCMVINERIRKFDLKSGWSDGEMLANVERWFYWVLNMRVKITDSKGKCEWLS